MRSFSLAALVCLVLALASALYTVSLPAQATGIDMPFPITNAAGKGITAVYVAPAKPGDDKKETGELSKTADWKTLDLGGKPFVQGATVNVKLKSDEKICHWHVLFTFVDKTNSGLFEDALTPCVLVDADYKMTLRYDESLRAYILDGNFHLDSRKDHILH
jgi:hypothetical protein